MESINLAGVLPEAGTQELAPDSKCMLNISLFIALPHLLDCLFSTTIFVSILLLLCMMG